MRAVRFSRAFHIYLLNYFQSQMCKKIVTKPLCISGMKKRVCAMRRIICISTASTTCKENPCRLEPSHRHGAWQQAMWTEGSVSEFYLLYSGKAVGLK